MALASLSPKQIRSYGATKLQQLWDEANVSRRSYVQDHQNLSLLPDPAAQKLSLLYVKAIRIMEKRMTKIESEMSRRS